MTNPQGPVKIVKERRFLGTVIRTHRLGLKLLNFTVEKRLKGTILIMEGRLYNLL